jgi:hypothetical protein
MRNLDRNPVAGAQVPGAKDGSHAAMRDYAFKLKII